MKILQTDTSDQFKNLRNRSNHFAGFAGCWGSSTYLRTVACRQLTLDRL